MPVWIMIYNMNMTYVAVIHCVWYMYKKHIFAANWKELCKVIAAVQKVIKYWQHIYILQTKSWQLNNIFPLKIVPFHN